MLKIKTRFISAVVVFAVFVTAMFGTALTAAATGAETAQSKLASVDSTILVEGYKLDDYIRIEWHLQSADETTVYAIPDGIKFAVYYTYRNNTTGVFGDWTVSVVPPQNNINSYIHYELPSIAKNSTYYMTVLPFVDTPSRQYGKFTPYFIPQPIPQKNTD